MTKCKICKESEEVAKIKYIGNVCEDCIPDLYELIEEASDNLFDKYTYPEISGIIVEKLDQGVLSDWIIKRTKLNDVGTIFLVMDEMMLSDEVDEEVKAKLMTIFEGAYEEVDVE